MYISAVVLTIIAWLIGLILDANVSQDMLGFLELRTLFPILTMGVFILKAINDRNSKWYWLVYFPKKLTWGAWIMKNKLIAIFAVIGVVAAIAGAIAYILNFGKRVDRISE